ncbi:44668_t:CDS:1, partial [Gigaspora margarita]
MNNQPKEGLDTKNKEIFFENSYIKAENDEDIIRYLGVWLN